MRTAFLPSLLPSGHAKNISGYGQVAEVTFRTSPGNPDPVTIFKVEPTQTGNPGAFTVSWCVSCPMQRV